LRKKRAGNRKGGNQGYNPDAQPAAGTSEGACDGSEQWDHFGSTMPGLSSYDATK
jgi:hypothetical protein